MGCGCGKKSSFARRKIVKTKSRTKTTKQGPKNTRLIASKKNYKIKSKAKKNNI